MREKGTGMAGGKAAVDCGGGRWQGAHRTVRRGAGGMDVGVYEQIAGLRRSLVFWPHSQEIPVNSKKGLAKPASKR